MLLTLPAWAEEDAAEPVVPDGWTNAITNDNFGVW